MKIINIVLITTILIMLNGCYFKTATYNSFKYKREYFVLKHNNQLIPKQHKERREIYDENRYIYKFNGDDLRCVYGYLTNRDDNPEKVIGWIIISGEEYCKETPGVGMWM